MELKMGWWKTKEDKMIFLQKLLGEWHYFDSNGWHPLDEATRNQLSWVDDQDK